MDEGSDYNIGILHWLEGRHSSYEEAEDAHLICEFLNFLTPTQKASGEGGYGEVLNIRKTQNKVRQAHRHYRG